MAQPGSVLLDGRDPRMYDSKTEVPETPLRDVGSVSGIKPQHRKIHDPDVTFEEYQYYAHKTRAEEDTLEPEVKVKKTILQMIFPTKSGHGIDKDEYEIKEVSPSPVEVMTISDDEWANASRALRTATRGAIFYLITTDILGPFGLPYAFATLGWGPGIALFTVFAGLAGYSGYLLWDLFMGLDSYQFPIRSFGDIGYRLYGPYMRYLFNILQSIQLILNVGLIIISNGEALSQASKFHLCFIVCCVIWAIIGMVFGQVRTLQKFGWFANFAVWLNVICMIISMAGSASKGPNYAAASQSAGAVINNGLLIKPNAQGVYPPVQTTGGLPNAGGFIGSVSGAMQAVFAYGGAMVFPEFMAEMKRPRDFLQAMWAAQAFIYLLYLFYGAFMYGYQGQYTVNPSYLGVSGYGLQLAGDIFAMISAAIAAALYGNIGAKVMYNNVFVEMFHAPQLTTTAGKFVWVFLVPVYWALAFIIGAAIPNFSGLTAVVASFCILHFTYTFPPLLHVAYQIKKAAALPNDGFDPTTGQTIQQDSGFKRFWRGFAGSGWIYNKFFYMNVANIIYTLGALALAGLGAYSAIEVLNDAFKTNSATSFTCKSPLQG